MSNIQEYNIELANKMIKYNIEEYFINIHNKFYNNLNIEFMNYFLSLIIKKDEFCVKQEKLQEYGIINKLKSSNIQDCLNKFNLKENRDYLISNVTELLFSSIKYKKYYTLTPRAFKLCLIKAKNSKVYAKYYLMLEDIFYYYKEYQIEYQNQLLFKKDVQIAIQIKKNERLHNDINTINEELQDVNDELESTNKKVDDLDDTVDDLNDKLDDLYAIIHNIRSSIQNNSNF